MENYKISENRNSIVTIKRRPQLADNIEKKLVP